MRVGAGRLQPGHAEHLVGVSAYAPIGLFASLLGAKRDLGPLEHSRRGDRQHDSAAARWRDQPATVQSPTGDVQVPVNASADQSGLQLLVELWLEPGQLRYSRRAAT